MNLPEPHQLLLARRGLARLPAFLPLDLFDVPIVRGTHKLERRPDGSLPEEAFRRVVSIPGPQGSRYTVTIQGDSQLGLPYGYDARVLIAVLILVRTLKAWDGVLPSPSLRQIARAMNEDADDTQVLRRIRESLDRLRRVMLVFSYEREVPSVEEVMTGAAAPQPPGRRRPRVTTSPNEWLIRSTLVDVNGDLRLDTLAVNPVFVRQGIAGSLLFIDQETFARQPKALAQRLYAVCASLRAHSQPTPWRIAEVDLQARCGDSTEPREFRRKARAAGADLITAGVLKSFEVAKENKSYVVAMEPGPLLGLAGLLRGVGLMDLDDTAAHMMVLAAMGMPERERRALMRDEPERVHWALMFVEYAQQNPAGAGLREGVTSPLGLFRHKMREPGFEEDVSFQTWLHGQYAAMRAAPAAGAEKKPSPAPLSPSSPNVDPEVQELWASIVDEMTRRTEDISARFHIRGVRGVSLTEDGTLVCATRSSTAMDYLQTPDVQADLREMAAAYSQGRVSDVVVGLDTTPSD